MVISMDKVKRSGSGVRTKGLRTSARKKEMKERIARKVEAGEPLTRSEQRKLNSMTRSQLSVRGKVTVAQEQKTDLSGFKKDTAGRWRNQKGHYVNADDRKFYGLD